MVHCSCNERSTHRERVLDVRRRGSYDGFFIGGGEVGAIVES